MLDFDEFCQHITSNTLIKNHCGFTLNFFLIFTNINLFGKLYYILKLFDRPNSYVST